MLLNEFYELACLLFWSRSFYVGINKNFINVFIFDVFALLFNNVYISFHSMLTTNSTSILGFITVGGKKEENITNRLYQQVLYGQKSHRQEQKGISHEKYNGKKQCVVNKA